MAELHADQLVQQAREMVGPEMENAMGLIYAGDNEPVLAACEAFYLAGCADEQAGDANDGLYHVYRVSRWLVFTDSQGFRELAEEGAETEAIARFRTCETELYANDES